METNFLTKETLFDKCYSEEELLNMGYEYTCQNFSKYLIYKKENKYFLIDEVKSEVFKIHYEFSDIV